jgi:imidazolonepropionase
VAVTSFVVTNIGELVTNDEARGGGSLGTVERAALVIEDDVVAWIGAAAELPEASGDAVVDADGRCVIPGFVDSHAHLVFAGDRVAEFADRAAGAPYRPGGILTTVTATRAAPTSSLLANAEALRAEALRSGTTTMESKSGYGLTVLDEQRSCEVANAIADDATFLGAHVVPPEFADDPDGYVGLTVGEMLPVCASSVRFVDVFCEDGAFDVDQATAVLRAGIALGLRPKVHANQLGPGPGVQLAVGMGAVSADHCSFLSDADVDALASSSTVATLLPITEFATRSPAADGRRLVDAGARIALAANCNPGSGFSTSMPLAIALAVVTMGLSFDEALLAATLGGAQALARDDVGALRPGAPGDFVLLDAPAPAYLAYRPGVDLVAGVWRRGVRVR